MTENPQPPREAAFFTTIREWGLVRETRGLGGVASGLGARVGMAPVPARLITVVAALVLPGLVLLAYAAAWGLLPDRNGRIIIQDFGRGVTNVGALLGIAAMAIIGMLTLDSGPLFSVFGGSWGWWNYGGGYDPFHIIATFFSVVIPLAVAGGITFLVIYLVRRQKQADQQVPPRSAPGTTWNSADAQETSADNAPAEGPEAPEGPVTDGTSAEPSPANSAPASGETLAAAAPASAVSTDAPRKPQPWEPAVPPQAAGGSAYAWSASTGYPTAAPPVGARANGPAAPIHRAPTKPPRVPGPGKGAWLALLGVVFVSAAGVLIVDRTTGLAVPWPLAWFAGLAIGLGLILVVVALAGRRLGFLGFMSVLVLIAGVVLSANSSDLTTAYDQARVDLGLETVDTEPSPGPNLPVDITVAEAFGDDYASAYVEGQCKAYPDGWVPSDDDGVGFTNRIPNAVTRVDEVTENTFVSLRAEVTDVTVPADTSLSVSGVNGQVVDWPERQVYCEVWSDRNDGPVIELTNPDSPVLTLNAYDGGTIYINEEVTS
ncbi:PspC domain-containing protein [Demequina flava]|uniref:PspC domain-containing protein n=1 Tax=Demequina flava TaxID=1095025 RepID=UPI00078598CF|nr:PspC domain-containing protein [Demequina flava]